MGQEAIHCLYISSLFCLQIKVYSDLLFGEGNCRTMRYPAFDYADSGEAVVDLTNFIAEAIRSSNSSFDASDTPVILSYAIDDDKVLLDASSWESFVHQREKVLFVVVDGIENDGPNYQNYIGKKFRAAGAGARISANSGPAAGRKSSSNLASSSSAAKTKLVTGMEMSKTGSLSPTGGISNRSSLPRQLPGGSNNNSSSSSKKAGADRINEDSALLGEGAATDAGDVDGTAARSKSPAKKPAGSKQSAVCAACGASDAKKLCPRCKLARYYY
jgi:hypothetical protein